MCISKLGNNTSGHPIAGELSLSNLDSEVDRMGLQLLLTEQACHRQYMSISPVGPGDGHRVCVCPAIGPTYNSLENQPISTEITSASSSYCQDPIKTECLGNLCLSVCLSVPLPLPLFSLGMVNLGSPLQVHYW